MVETLKPNEAKVKLIGCIQEAAKFWDGIAGSASITAVRTKDKNDFETARDYCARSEAAHKLENEVCILIQQFWPATKS